MFNCILMKEVLLSMITARIFTVQNSVSYCWRYSLNAHLVVHNSPKSTPQKKKKVRNGMIIFPETSVWVFSESRTAKCKIGPLEKSPQKPLSATRKYFLGHCYVQKDFLRKSSNGPILPFGILKILIMMFQEKLSYHFTLFYFWGYLRTVVRYNRRDNCILYPYPDHKIHSHFYALSLAVSLIDE